MVNPGHISRGCLQCRARKVKCDETRPTCRRCLGYGKPCPGYREISVFRSENEKLRFKFEWTHSIGLMATHPKAQEMTTTNTSEGFYDEFPKVIPTALMPTAEELSLCYFMSSFVYSSPDDVFRGHLDFLPQLYSDGGKKCQDLALMSVAYLAGFHKWRCQSLFEKARKLYGAAMRSLQDALQSPESARSNNTFAAALILGLFVDMSDERQITANPHMDGIYQLLILRCPDQFYDNLGYTLSSYALTQLCIEFWLRKDVKYQRLALLLPWFSSHDLLGRARTIAIRQIDLCCRFMDVHALLDDRKGAAQLDSHHFNERVSLICKAVEASFIQLKDTEQFTREAQNYLESNKQVQPKPLSQNNAFDQKACKDVGIASSIAVIRSSQILFYSELMRCCEKLEELTALSSTKANAENLHFDISWLKERIKESIADVVFFITYTMKTSTNEPEKENSSLPTGFGALAHLIIWPAYAVAQCPLSTANQVSYSREVLWEVGSSTGISTAYRLLNIPLFDPTPLLR